MVSKILNSIMFYLRVKSLNFTSERLAANQVKSVK